MALGKKPKRLSSIDKLARLPHGIPIATHGQLALADYPRTQTCKTCDGKKTVDACPECHGLTPTRKCAACRDNPGPYDCPTCSSVGQR